MGYTHYWETTPSYTFRLNDDSFDDFIQDVLVIMAKSQLKTYPTDLTCHWYDQKIRDGFDPKKTLYEMTFFYIGYDPNEGMIVVINGMEPYDFETATFTATPDNPNNWNFCKTEYRPYDLVLCAILISYKHHFKDVVRVSSDGNAADWKMAAEWWQDMFSRQLPEDGPWVYEDESKAK